MTHEGYIHGYNDREMVRLNDQAETLDRIIHNDTYFNPGSLVLEAGCGVGAQTRIIAPQNREATFISIDISADSISEARKQLERSRITNVELRQADIYDLPFADEYFDGVMVCFVLEHLGDPVKALIELKRVLKKNGKMIVIEGDHGSAFFYPESRFARLAIDCQVKLQAHNGGNCNIGRALYPLMTSAGLLHVSVTPRVVYADASKPELVEGFIKSTFTAMIEGIRDKATKEGMMDKDDFDKGIHDLYRTSEPDGVFSYTFFKGFAVK
jgi:ubiquinone/menaquinone biosynthesis C-methylase UbiE